MPHSSTHDLGSPAVPYSVEQPRRSPPRAVPPAAAHRRGAGRLRAKARRSSGTGTAILPAFFGFLAGALFWHLVGFWSFLDKVVFEGRSEQRAAVSGFGCTDLVLDRASGHTRRRSCEQGAPSMGVRFGDPQHVARADASAADTTNDRPRTTSGGAAY